MSNFSSVVEHLLEDETKEAIDKMLLETQEQRIIRILGGDKMPMNYLMKFEEYLDDHDLYLYNGWEDATIIYKPKIDKFWVTVYLFCKDGTELQGLKRLTNDLEGQNKIQIEKTEGGHIVGFKILKRYLDNIEKQNQDKAEELSDEEMKLL